MGPVAERCVPGMSAAAERDRGAPSEPELLAILIHDGEVAFDAKWAVSENCNFCASQGFLRFENPKRVFRDAPR